MAVPTTNEIGLRPRFGLVSRSLILGLTVSLCFVVVTLAPSQAIATAALGAAAGLLATAAISEARRLARARASARIAAEARSLFEGDPVPHVVSDERFGIVVSNPAAEREFDVSGPAQVAALISNRVAGAEALARRLMRQVLREGHAAEDVAADGGQLRVSGRRLGAGLVLWRLEPVADVERVLPLLPSISVDGEGRVVAVSGAAEARLGRRPCHVSEFIEGDPSGRVLQVSGAESATPLVALDLASDDGGREIVLLDGPVAGASARPAEKADFLDTLPVPTLRLATDGTLLAANAPAAAILSLDRDGPLPAFFELVEGLGRPVAEWVSDAASGRGLLKPEIVRARGERKEMFLQITLGRIEGEDGAELVAILNDATELKTLEAQFVQSQKMQAIGQLAGGVAHDFNNLLTAISGHCDLLLLRHDEGDPDYADLMQIEQNANRAASLVGQLLAFSRKQNLRPHALDLRDTMSDLAHLLNRLVGERVTLELTFTPGPKVIRADRRQLEQVVMNLVVNARDAMSEGGRIEVRTRSETVTEALKRDRAEVPPGDYVVIEVSDEGQGISPERLPKIFEPFYTTKATGEGTGLGLSTAYGIVKQTGGFIFADSDLGRGSVFSLYFPAHDTAREDPAPMPEAPTGGARAPRGEGVVLLVEDEAPVRAFASRALKLKGYTVLEADCAEAALDLLKDAAIQVDVFVTDVIMPGLDGPTWVREALAVRPDTRVVFMSGYAEEGLAETQARVPNSTFLPKPFSLAQLTETVGRQLR